MQKEGKKVFETAFESYFESGYRGGELKSKALSQYTNWVAKEWEKPLDFSEDELPFFRSIAKNEKVTLKKELREKRSTSAMGFRIRRNSKKQAIKEK